MNRFVLRSLDDVTGSSLHEVLLTLEDDSALRKILEDDDLQPGMVFELDGKELKIISDLFFVNMEGNASKGELICVNEDFKFDPNSHTGRELRLMLEGKKPFAAFVDLEPSVSDEEIIPESFFAPFVASGRFTKRTYIQLSSDSGRPALRYVMYAATNETWRFNAYIALKNLGQKYKWNSGFERMEGFLLGYESEIDDFYT